MERTDQHPAAHEPRAWDSDDNKPVIPKIPGPRKPQSGGQR